MVVLWIGAVLLLLVMLYYWKVPDTESIDSRSLLSKPANVFADELLLSSQDLEIGESANLINITLNREGDAKIQRKSSSINTAPERKLVYSKILKNKIKKISSTSASASGFIIKPLPQ